MPLSRMVQQIILISKQKDRHEEHIGNILQNINPFIKITFLFLISART